MKLTKTPVGKTLHFLVSLDANTRIADLFPPTAPLALPAVALGAAEEAAAAAEKSDNKSNWLSLS